MVALAIAKVKIKKAGWRRNQWRASSYGINGEQIAHTEAYVDKRDAAAAAETIACGAPITFE